MRPHIAGPSRSEGSWLGRYVGTLSLVFVWRAPPLNLFAKKRRVELRIEVTAEPLFIRNLCEGKLT